MISVVVPLYNEGDAVLRVVAHLRQVAGVAEVVLVDSSDQPQSLATLVQLQQQLQMDNDPLCRVLKCHVRGRALQMNAGAEQCRGATLLFLHCDTRLPATAAQGIARRLAQGHVWGWFNLRLDARGSAYRLLERMINLRSRCCRIATGDQAMFVQRRVFIAQRGFAEIALMEDIELSRRLKRCGQPGAISQPVLTSARRWQKNGVVRTVLCMWKLRFLYWLGGNPEGLARRYQNVR